MSGLDALLAGHTLVKRYRIDEVIGRGGFAAVYQAHDQSLDRTVAVKVITLAGPEGALPEEARARFQREARASAGLEHPNVVAVYDFGTDPTLGLDFLVMERLVGQDLRARLADPTPIPLDDALHIIRSAAAGLAAGHQAGIIHRDIKPANVFLDTRSGLPRARVCVLDFGIALLAAADDATRLTRHGVPLSVGYASPEQLAGKGELTPASDVFGLGVLAYEILTRHRPFSSDPLRAVEERQVDPTPLRELNPGVPAPIAAAVHRALAPDPANRFTDAAAFADALRTGQVDPHVSPPARGPSPAVASVTSTEAARPASGRGRAAAIAATVLVLGGVGAALTLAGHDPPARSRVASRDAPGAPAVLPRPAPTAPVVMDSAIAVPHTERRAGEAPTRPDGPAADAAAPKRREPSPPAVATRRAESPPEHDRRGSAVEPAADREFKPNLTHPCQSRADGEAVACLTQDLEEADDALNRAFREAMSRLDGPRRQSLLDSQRAWLARYDAVITSYYSTSWGAHSRVRVLPSQIRALRDRTAYLRGLGH